MRITLPLLRAHNRRLLLVLAARCVSRPISTAWEWTRSKLTSSKHWVVSVAGIVLSAISTARQWMRRKLLSAGLALLPIGLMFTGDPKEYALGMVLMALGGLFVMLSAWFWTGFNTHPGVTKVIRVVAAPSGLAIVFVSVLWVFAYKPAEEPWSNFLKKSISSKKVVQNATINESPPPIAPSPTVKLESKSTTAVVARPPSAEEIAAEIAERTRARELFIREQDKPIIGLYMIARLRQPIMASELKSQAVVLSMYGLDDSRPGFNFGIRSDSEQLIEYPSGKAIVMPGIRSKIWTFPRNITDSSREDLLDNFLVTGPDQIDRLESGAILTGTPFSTMRDLDRATVSIKATAPLSEWIKCFTVVCNDYVIVELCNDEIRWSPPPPSMEVALLTGVLKDGKLSDQQIVTRKSVKHNIAMPIDFEPYVFGIAHFPRHRTPEQHLSMRAMIDLSAIQVRMHKIIGLGLMPHKAGKTGSMMIQNTERGWLPPHLSEPAK